MNGNLSKTGYNDYNDGHNDNEVQTHREKSLAGATYDQCFDLWPFPEDFGLSAFLRLLRQDLRDRQGHQRQVPVQRRVQVREMQRLRGDLRPGHRRTLCIKSPNL